SGTFLPGKFADTAVIEVLNNLKEYGCLKSQLLVCIAGGAQMFALQKESNILNVGMRNTIAVKAMLAKENLKLIASDTGGNQGRTLKLDIPTGIVYVRSVRETEKILGGNLCPKY
ncbi:MAG: hypothetical protein PHV68_04350, partial [Candidatus Gastranaerophilales bacterium]|nr:hypothetical protein [Candidatus Gastranaerophilales bacterium]